MAVAQVIEIPGGTKEQYEAVIREIGVTGDDLAPGQLVHFAGPMDGGWRVVNVWESQEAAETFTREKVVPARQKVGMPNPPLGPFHPVHRLAK